MSGKKLLKLIKQYDIDYFRSLLLLAYRLRGKR